jgi:SNF2 family DNA or RNA helicase
LSLYATRCVELHGKVPLNKRRIALEAFRKSTREHGPRVLILSTVGMVGLNLACANIMIMAVSRFLTISMFRHPLEFH